ncbi:MAG: hypothetical protein ACR2NU_01765, partial [Aeoliella sp.]
MPIALECPDCHATIEVDESFAGRSGKCKNCGAKVTVPATSESDPLEGRVPIRDATPEHMIAELARRRIRAVLAYSDPPTESLDDPASKSRQGLNCLKTGNLTEDNVCHLFGQLAEQAKREQARRLEDTMGDASGLFALKDDRLGMDLAEFKKRHRREIAGLGKTMPWCSDETPDKDVPALMAEAWHTGAHIVSCRLDMPAEHNSPSIAGVETESVVYRFLDGKLFQIEALFFTKEFGVVNDSLRKKYGSPTSEHINPRRVTWSSPTSTVELTFGSVRPSRPAHLEFRYDKLFSEAVSR